MKVIKYLIFLFCIYSLFSQNKIYTEKFPDFLIQENEYLDSFPKTNFIFILSPSDFILCKKNPIYYKESLLKQQYFQIEFLDKIYTDAGNFNNDVIEYYLKTYDINLTIKKLQEGYNKDPLFFAFLYNLGRLYLLKKDYNKSIFYFNKTFYYFPEYPRIHYYLGKNYLLLNNEIQGEYHFKKAIQLNPDQIEYYIDFINILYDKKQYAKAKLYFSHGIKKFNEHNYFKIFKANYLIKEKKFSKALNILLEIDKNKLNEFELLELNYTLFVLYEKTSQLDKALNQINKILSYKNPYFFNKYSRELLLSQKERLEKIIKK
ncbi:MAG: hypothetical protein KatS3mg129_2008 [Leptospiraceae bacterium]|nr:MAG: hypothetical protein KatS3mg129_2008 [Leptospiraceae bacterium]